MIARRGNTSTGRGNTPLLFPPLEIHLGLRDYNHRPHHTQLPLPLDDIPQELTQGRDLNNIVFLVAVPLGQRNPHLTFINYLHISWDQISLALSIELLCESATDFSDSTNTLDNPYPNIQNPAPPPPDT